MMGTMKQVPAEENADGTIKPTSTVKPTVGRIVYYKLSELDANSINKRREDYRKNPKTDWPQGAQAHVGNQALVGHIYPMVIVAVWNDELINGHVILDGNDSFWATSVKIGSDNGNWDWMPFQKDQQLKLKNSN
jgi:hypothetical protein